MSNARRKLYNAGCCVPDPPGEEIPSEDEVRRRVAEVERAKFELFRMNRDPDLTEEELSEILP